VNEAPEAETIRLRYATVVDADAVAALHADRIAEGFLVTLGAPFLARLYRRIVRSPRAFVIVADTPSGTGQPRRVCGFIAVAESTGALYREFLVRDGVAATVAAARGVARAPLAVLETLRYGLRGGGAANGAEVLATAVATERGGQGVGTRLVQAAVDEIRRRGAAWAHVVTAVGNVGATKAYERGGFRAEGIDEVHRGVPQQLLVWP
jgi:ribosomal protein S18 acetylase RimI-like enzyme